MLQTITPILSCVFFWEVFSLHPSRLCVFFLCRWSHSYSNRSDVWLCRSGRDRSLHREDDTVRSFAALLGTASLAASRSDLTGRSEPVGAVETSSLILHLPSLGRFFTLLHHEAVVVNRWFTWFQYWQGCTTSTDSDVFVTCSCAWQIFLGADLKACWRKLGTQHSILNPF